MKRIRTGNAATLSRTFYDATLAAADLDAAPTVTVADLAGTTVTSGTATSAGSGVYTFDVGPFDDPALYNVTWAGARSGKAVSEVDQLEVRGGAYFELIELKDMDGVGDRFDVDQLEAARVIAEDTIEGYCERAFVPTYAREIYDGNGGYFLYVDRSYPTRVLAATIDGTAQTTTDWTVSSAGKVDTAYNGIFTWAAGGQNVALEYVHGLTRPPSDLARAALRLARHVLLTETTTVPDRANLMTTEFATFRLQTADENRDRPTGLPEVDAVLNRYAIELPTFA